MNREVTRLQSDQAMNDKCLDLQKSDTKDGAQAGCPYLRGDSQQTFREHALVRVHPPYDKTRPPLTSCPCACFRPRCTTLRSLAAWENVSGRARTTELARLRAWPRLVYTLLSARQATVPGVHACRARSHSSL